MKLIFLISAIAVLAPLCSAQPARRQPAPATLGLESGTVDRPMGGFTLKLVKSTGAAVGLLPDGGGGFDFLPSDRLQARASDRFVHLGDLSLKIRLAGGQEWQSLDTYTKRVPLKTPDGGLSQSLTGSFQAESALEVVRTWKPVKNGLQLLFTLKNRAMKPVEIGALGIPMPFNNIIMERSLEEAHAKCSFTDPYIGEDAGFLRVCQLSGSGQNMIVTPVGRTPLEAWRLVHEPMWPNQVFEGMMEWMVHTKAYAETEWKGVEQWNTPTEGLLEPGRSVVYGVQFTRVPAIRDIEPALVRLGRPLAVGIPGYVLPQDQKGKLFLKYGRPVKAIKCEPAGSVEWAAVKEGSRGWQAYSLQGRRWGRSRLTVTYTDGLVQTVSLYVTKPQAQAASDLGRFLTHESWFTDEKDPFGRAPSAITYDREAGAQVVQDPRVWIAGLGDEGGSGSWVALAMKQFGQPDPEETAKLEDFVNKVLWGNLQFSSGPKAYGVRKSVFYYDPKKLPEFAYRRDFDWRSWTSWSFDTTNDIGRGYNYPHVVAAYWSLYRIARNAPQLVRQRSWEWYLDQAFKTTEFLTSVNDKGEDVVGYWRLGLMEGTIFTLLLDDLRREGWKEKADLIEARMKDRAERWRHEPYPFGSEMAWDSTGQEEVYMWCSRFGYQDKAQVTLNSILAYDPAVPHWGYNGNARRYWDFLYGAKLSRIERQLHHYGSGLNAIPLLHEFRLHPDDLYLLRVGYGGTMGPITNIDQDGFASAAFHSFPSTLKWDAYSGDYGPSFFGHAVNTGCWLTNTKDFGWQAFGGEAAVNDGWIHVRPQDTFRRRIFVAPAGLSLTLDAGRFAALDFNPKTGEAKVTLDPADRVWTSARLVVEATVPGKPQLRPVGPYPLENGAYSIKLGAKPTEVILKPLNAK